MIIITSKIFKKIGGNNYIENIQRNRWEELDQKYSKESVGIPRSKILKGSVGIIRSKNTTKLLFLNV